MSGRAPKGTGMIRKRPDGRWEGRYTLGFDPKTGKPKIKYYYGKTQKEVRQKLSEIAVQVDEGNYLEPSKMKISAWLDLWLKTYIEPVLKPYTVASYKNACDHYIKPTLGNIALGQLHAIQIQQLYNSLQSEHDLSAKTVKNIHGIFHHALEQAVKMEMIKSNPSDLCTLPKVRRKEFHPMEEKDIAAFLKVIKGTRFENVYMVTLFTGMRQGEVLGLTWDCVDFEHNTIYINKQLQKTQKVGGTYTLVSTKSGRSRLITVADSVMAALKAESFKQHQNMIAASSAWNNPMNLVFTNELGGNLCHFTVYKYFKRLVTDIGIPEERFHDLRHSYAVVSIESGDDIKTVQGNLGHATASFTLDVYGHVSQRMRKQSAERMERFIRNVSSR